MDGNKIVARPTSFAIARGTVVVIALATAADYVLDRYHLCSSHTQASFILPCVRVTAAAAAEWRALWLAMLCCAVLEAAVAALALRLPCRRRALAYLQLALAMVRHYMCLLAALILLAAADAGYHLIGICVGSISWFIGRNFASIIVLLLFGDEERGVQLMSTASSSNF